MKLYHGTQVQNIEQLKPFATRGNAISKPVICFTPNYCIALLYIWNRSYKWITFSENENGKVVFTEHSESFLVIILFRVHLSPEALASLRSAMSDTNMPLFLYRPLWQAIFSQFSNQDPV